MAFPSRVALLVAGVLVMLGLSAAAAAAAAEGRGSVCFRRVFSFGDSLTDTGNLLVSSPLSNHIVGRYPYGITYFHRPTGRCSDGRLVIDHLGTACSASGGCLGSQIWWCG